MACWIIIFHQQNFYWSYREKSLPAYDWPLRWLLWNLQALMDLNQSPQPIVSIFGYLIKSCVNLFWWPRARPSVNYSIIESLFVIKHMILFCQTSFPNIIVHWTSLDQPHSKNNMGEELTVLHKRNTLVKSPMYSPHLNHFNYQLLQKLTIVISQVNAFSNIIILKDRIPYTWGYSTQEAQTN